MTASLYSTAGQTPLKPGMVTFTRNPTTTDISAPSGVAYNVGQEWFNSTTSSFFKYIGGGVWVSVLTASSQLTAHGVVLGEGTSPLSATPAGTNGQLLIASTGADPAFATLGITGTGLVQTGGANSLTLAIQTGGFSASSVAGTSQAMAVQNSYVSANAGLTTFTLPATANVGDTMVIVGKGAAFWKIAQNAGQTIHYNAASTTTGVTGTITSTQAANSITLYCSVANTDFVVLSASGAQAAYTIV